MAGQDDQAKPISLFYSYSHKDEDLRRKLETHLAALRRGGLIAEWHDRKLEPGEAWKDEIDRHLMSADIVLLLVSADFIDSDYCWGEEMTKALARHAREEARVIPVILRYCRWQSTPLGRLQAVPKDAKPIRSWPDEDEAFDNVVAAIECAVQSVRQRAEEVTRLADAAGQTQAPSEARARGTGPAATDPAAAPEPAGVVPPPHALPGTPPPALPALEGEPDDLKRINCIGPGIEKTLHELGIYHFRQIAELTPDNVAWIDQRLRFRGRIAREDWVGQARRLAAGESVDPAPTALTPASEEPSTVLRRTKIRAGDTLALPDSPVLSRPEIRRPGTVFRDIEAPWCPEMVVIPAGWFIMGSPEGEAERTNAEGPQHEVTFARPFALGRYLITFDEYDHFCAQTKREKPSDQGCGRGRPVINVSWKDAQAYCAWLGEQTGQRYRLPSEAEWEYACRAGTITPFWTGATISTEQANYDGSYTYGSGRKGEYREQTTPVDAFEANPWGLHDMHGNVWEWCEDCWNDSYRSAPTDGLARLQGNCSYCVVRGGSWLDPPRLLRSAVRYWLERSNRFSYLGFRVSRTLIP